MVDHNPGFLARKTYYVRGHGWSDMMASVGKILIEHHLCTTYPHQKPLLRQLRLVVACPRLSHVTVRVLLPTDDRTTKFRLLAEAHSRRGATTDMTLREITQVCRELIEKIGEGLIFETKCPQVEERIKNWAQYMKVCRELREMTDQMLKNDITSLGENLQPLCNFRRSWSSLHD